MVIKFKCVFIYNMVKVPSKETSTWSVLPAGSPTEIGNEIDAVWTDLAKVNIEHAT